MRRVRATGAVTVLSVLSACGGRGFGYDSRTSHPTQVTYRPEADGPSQPGVVTTPQTGRRLSRAAPSPVGPGTRPMRVFRRRTQVPARRGRRSPSCGQVGAGPSPVVEHGGPVPWAPRVRASTSCVGVSGGAAGPPSRGRRGRMRRYCQIDGCNRPHRARGWCQLHYRRWHQTGDPGPAHARPPRPHCQIDGCDRPHHARGWCELHYKRWHTYGDPGPAQPKFEPARTVTVTRCELDDCSRPVRCRGLCNLHYKRLCDGRPLEGPTSLPVDCQIDGCGQPRRARGWCKHHYDRWRRGTLDRPVRKAPEPAPRRVCEDCGAAPLAGGRWCLPCFQTHARPGRDGCGSEAGYVRHRRAGEVPCVRCRQAHNLRNRERDAA